MATDLRIDAGRDLTCPTLRISYDSSRDFLWALVPGAVIDGQRDDETEELLDGLYLWRDGPDGALKGFGVSEAFEWDVLGQTEPFVWGADGLRFDVPTLAVRNATIGEIVLAAQQSLDSSTPDVVLFHQAVQTGESGDWEQAASLWRLCLAAGEMKAHFGLGYSLVELDRPREAYGHLAMYTEITPRLAWAWVWRGRAAMDMGELDDARVCFEQAVEVDDDEETDALEWLEEVEA